MTNTETTVEQLRRQIFGWLSYHDLDHPENESRLRLPETWNGDQPEGTALVFWFEGLPFGNIADAIADDWCELNDSFEDMLIAHGYWYEYQNSCVMWIYKDEDDFSLPS